MAQEKKQRVSAKDEGEWYGGSVGGQGRPPLHLQAHRSEEGEEEHHCCLGGRQGSRALRMGLRWKEHSEKRLRMEEMWLKAWESRGHMACWGSCSLRVL